MRRAEWWGLLKETAAEGSADQITRLGASLAYYTVFSLAPLALIAVSLVGVVFGDKAAQGAVFSDLSHFMGAAQARAVQHLILSARRSPSGSWAGATGVVLLLFGASSVVGELQSALNRIFDVPAERFGWAATLKQRLISLGFVLGVGFLLVVSMAVSTAISAAGRVLGALAGFSVVLLYAANLSATLAIISLLFALMFRYLPLTRIAWRDAWKGGATTAFLFIAGNLALSLYLGKAGPVSVYGAAGSLLAVLLWSYYCAQIFYLGAEFTHVYARRHARARAR